MRPHKRSAPAPWWMVSRHAHLRQRCAGVVGSTGNHVLQLAAMTGQCGIVEPVVHSVEIIVQIVHMVQIATATQFRYEEPASTHNRAPSGSRRQSAGCTAPDSGARHHRRAWLVESH